MTESLFQQTLSRDALDAGHRRAWLSLRKLLVLLVLMAVAPLVVIELAGSQREQKEEVERAHESIDALAEVVAGSHARMADGMGQFLTALATTPVLTPEDRKACARSLNRLLAMQPAYLNFGLIDLDGHLVCHALDAGAEVNLGDREYFRRAVQTGRLTVSNYQVGRVSGQRSIVVALPLKTDDARIKGVVYAALDLSQLAGSLRGGDAVPGARVQLADTQGVVLTSSEDIGGAVGTAIADAVLRNAVRTGRVGLVNAPADETPAVLRAVRPVRVDGQNALYVTVTVPTERIIAPALRNLRLRLAGILALALAVAVAVWAVGHRLVVRPLERLIGGLRQVETGDYGQAMRQPATPMREMRELQHSLGSLVMGLEEQRFERDQALDALSEREARYRELFKSNPQVMYVYEVRSLGFLAVNEAATAYYGYSRDEFLAMTLLDIRPESEHAALLERLSGAHPAVAGEAPRVWTHRKRSGETRQVEVIVHPTVFEGHSAELVMATDVTARLVAEARVRELTDKLEQRVAERTRELELSNRELEAFSYSVSHDLRNPLGAIGMFGQMLSAHLGERADAQAAQCLARIEQGVRGMERLIDDLMALAQVTRTDLVMAQVDLTALSHEVLDELRGQDPRRQVVVTLEDGLRCTGDEGLLRRLLANLIGNAWKFTAHTPAARIRIGCRKGGAAGDPLVFFVQDNGAGFDMKFAGRLFLPFERLHGDHDFPGTGIGLATVQRIVARHRGRIWADAAVGLGATFYFTINPSMEEAGMA